MSRKDAEHGVSGAEAVVAVLESFGIEICFGMCGHTNLWMLDAIQKSKIRFVGVRHEQVAAHAADGYFRATRKPAAVLTTIGPGLTNALTGFGDALLDGSAVVAIVGDAPNYFHGREAFQELSEHAEADQISIVRPLVKRAWRVSHRATLVPNAIEACNVALSGNPGPTVLSVPLNFFSEFRDETLTNLVNRRPTSYRSAAPEEQLILAFDLLSKGQRPLILAGGGAVNSQCQSEITELAELLKIPVITTLSGQGSIRKDHNLYGGFISTVGTPQAHRLINSCDVLLVLGSRLGEMETSSFDSAISINTSETKIIQVDIDPRQIGRQYPVAVGVVSDVKLLISEFLKLAKKVSSSNRSVPANWSSEIEVERKEWQKEIKDSSNWDGIPISVERMLSDIREVLPKEGIFLTDVGIRHIVAQQFDVYSSQTHYLASGWGTMGGAVAAALGAKVGCPDVPVISEVGDGAFSSVISSVITAVENDIAVVWVVMNNFGFSSISVYQAKHGLGNLGTSFKTATGKPYNPDFAALAIACGACGETVTNPSELKPALLRAIASGRPYVLDVHTDPAPKFRATGKWDVNDLLAGITSKNI